MKRKGIIVLDLFIYVKKRMINVLVKKKVSWFKLMNEKKINKKKKKTSLRSDRDYDYRYNKMRNRINVFNFN